MKFIPVCEPTLLGNESKYVRDAIETGWISSSASSLSEDVIRYICQTISDFRKGKA